MLRVAGLCFGPFSILLIDFDCGVILIDFDWGIFFPKIKILHPRIKTYVIDITHRYITPPTHNGHLNGRPRNFGPVRFSLTMTFTMII